MTDTPQNPFAEMMRMGQEWARAMNPALEHFTPKGFEALIPTMPKDMMETFMGKTFNPEGLDAKTRLLVTLGGLVATGALAEGVTHYAAMQGNSNAALTITIALNNAVNVTRYYEAQGDTVEVEIVAYGPGLTMFIPDRSPVEDRIHSMSLEYQNMSFSACGNTHANWSQREGAEVPLLENVSITPSGVILVSALTTES